MRPCAANGEGSGARSTAPAVGRRQCLCSGGRDFARRLMLRRIFIRLGAPRPPQSVTAPRQRRGGRDFFDQAITQQLADHFAGCAALKNIGGKPTRGRMARSQCLGRMAVPLIPANALAGPPMTPDAPAPRRTTMFPPMFAGLGIILAAVGLGLG
jgi:hypothetical protein